VQSACGVKQVFNLLVRKVIYFCIFIFGGVLAPTIAAYAQNEVPAVSADNIIWAAIKASFKLETGNFLSWGFAAFFAAISACFRYQLTKITQKFQSLFAPISQVDTSKSYNSVVVAGLSGSGKTTLIKSLTSDPQANPDVETPEYSIFSYEHVFPASANDAKSCKVFLSDYPGTNPGALVAGFIEQQKLPFSQMRYGHVQSIVIVVDLFGPPSAPGVVQRPKAAIDSVRVDENRTEWNYQVLSMLIGLVPQAKFLCLFINKVDLLNLGVPEAERDAKVAYKDLFNILAQLGRGAEVKRIVGSTKTGEGADELRKLLIKHAKVYGT
jgi:GTPase SAR1 family protein